MEAVTEFSSDRTFRLWAYTVSHAQLLLRSTRTESHPTRIEVLFKDVRYVALPTTMEGIAVYRCDASEVPPELATLSPDGPWFRVGSGDVMGYVAGIAFVREDELEYHDPSAFDFSHTLGATSMRSRMIIWKGSKDEGSFSRNPYCSSGSARCSGGHRLSNADDAPG
jgi:hypothetical protein